MRRTALMAGLAMVCTLAACGGSGTTAGPTSAVTVTHTVTATVTKDVTRAPSPDPTSSTSDTGAVMALGQWANFGPVKIRVQQVISSLPEANDQGEPWMAAMTQICFTNLPNGQGSFLSWGPWSMSGPDGSQYPASSGVGGNFLLPEYPFSGSKLFHNGQCAKGWIGYPVPKGTKVATIDYSNDAGESASWHLTKDGRPLTSGE